MEHQEVLQQPRRGTENGYSALTFGNVNTYCVHDHKNVTPLLLFQLVNTSFTQCPFNLLWGDPNATGRRLNLHKANAANEDLVRRLSYGCKAQGGFHYTDFPYILTA